MKRASMTLGEGMAWIACLIAALWVVSTLDGPGNAPSGPSSTFSTAAPITVSTVASTTWTSAPASSVIESSRTLRTVAPSDYARHYRIGARCRDGWRSDARGSGACSWHGGVQEWLYADDRIVHDTETGRELGTLKWVSVQVGYEVQRRDEYSLSPDETTAACDRVFTQWKRVTDMRERDRDEFVCIVSFAANWPLRKVPGAFASPPPKSG
jgi:hypothetical protein